jgi:hypothetical protein
MRGESGDDPGGVLSTRVARICSCNQRLARCNKSDALGWQHNGPGMTVLWKRWRWGEERPSRIAGALAVPYTGSMYAKGEMSIMHGVRCCGS